MRYIIHIGPHKTGTSYIQKECAQRRNELRECGIYYPKDWNTFLDGHTGLFHQLVQEHYDFFGKNFSIFLEGVKNTDKIVLFSNENLEELPIEAVKVLAKYFSPGKTSIVYYVRRWTDLLRSNWQEKIKHGDIMQFPGFMFGQFIHALDSPIVNYNLVLGKYADVFGPEHILVRCYDNIVQTGGNVFDDIISLALRAPPPISGRPYLENPSFQPFEIEIIRYLNCALFAEGEQRSSRVREAYMSVRKSLRPLLDQLERLLLPYYRQIDFALPAYLQEKIEHELFRRFVNIGPIAEDGRLFAPGGEGVGVYCRSDILIDKTVNNIIQIIIQRVAEVL